jgi:hypothetical protein
MTGRYPEIRTVGRHPQRLTRRDRCQTNETPNPNGNKPPYFAESLYLLHSSQGVQDGEPAGAGFLNHLFCSPQRGDPVERDGVCRWALLLSHLD